MKPLFFILLAFSFVGCSSKQNNSHTVRNPSNYTSCSELQMRSCSEGDKREGDCRPITHLDGAHKRQIFECQSVEQTCVDQNNDWESIQTYEYVGTDLVDC